MVIKNSTKVETLQELPSEIIKYFYNTEIIIQGNKTEKLYFGYIWATTNWVEVHCFEERDLKKELLKFTKKNLFVQKKLNLMD